MKSNTQKFLENTKIHHNFLKNTEIRKDTEELPLWTNERNYYKCFKQQEKICAYYQSSYFKISACLKCLTLMHNVSTP